MISVGSHLRLDPRSSLPGHFRLRYSLEEDLQWWGSSSPPWILFPPAHIISVVPPETNVGQRSYSVSLHDLVSSCALSKALWKGPPPY